MKNKQDHNIQASANRYANLKCGLGGLLAKMPWSWWLRQMAGIPKLIRVCEES